MSSEIANALAKARERIGQPPDLAGGVPAPGPAAQNSRAAASIHLLRRAQNSRRFWVILVTLALPATCYILWLRIQEAKRNAAAPEPADTSVPAEVRHAVLPPAPVYPSAAPAAAAAALVPAADLAETTNLKPELMIVVANWTITAVMPGTPARIVIANRVIRAGEPVDEHLTFLGIANGQLYFSDKDRAIYGRRY